MDMVQEEPVVGVMARRCVWEIRKLGWWGWDGSSLSEMDNDKLDELYKK